MVAQAGRTHLPPENQAEALSMGREVAVLRAGRLVQTAPLAVLYRTPADLDVGRFVGEATVVPGHARAGIVSCALGEIPLIDPQLEGPVETMIRPEQIQILRAGSGPVRTSFRGYLAIATAVAGTFYGPDTVVRLRVDRLKAPVNVQILGPDAPGPGERVALALAGPVMAYPTADPGCSRDHAPAAHDPLRSAPVGRR